MVVVSPAFPGDGVQRLAKERAAAINAAVEDKSPAVS